MEHQIKRDADWFDSRYQGEDRDDGAANEMSIVPDADGDRLDVLVSNIGFDGRQYDNTFSLTRQDVKQLSAFLENWLKKNQNH